ncbi:stalk domain-containing protein [Paenibacillus amylolyticus]|uniref:stalk domain-containing protein n=1 Tax=Paenibacillus amylolyticus TaxID=1451 RepID=UPI003EB743BB
MKKILVFILLVTVAISMPWPSLANAQTNNTPVQLYVNEKPTDIQLMRKAGTVYVPFREFLQRMGYQTAYSVEKHEISALIGESTFIFYPDDGYISGSGDYYELQRPGIQINGKFYLPIRFAAWLTKHAVQYDKESNTARMVEYGYGQEKAVLDLLTTYDRAFSVNLLASDNLEKSYLRDMIDLPKSEIQDLRYNVNITSITYESANQALLYVTYIHNNQVINDEHEVVFRIRKENNEWKVLQYRYLSVSQTIPNNIDQVVAAIRENSSKQQEFILSDLRTYYKALSEEDFDLTYKYTSPFIIEQINTLAGDQDWMKWENGKKSTFAYEDSTYHLSNERVVFLGEKQAVVHATLNRDFTSHTKERYPIIYEALIYLDYANGHWNYRNDLDITPTEAETNRTLSEIFFPELD